ncbi:MAG: hypothetical protein ACSLFN_03760 [Candidatus Limnocylindrales bacterium]
MRPPDAANGRDDGSLRDRLSRVDLRPLRYPLAVGGYLNAAAWLIVLFGIYGSAFPGIDIAVVFHPVGEAFLRDQRPYTGLFFYGPPWAPILGLFALLPAAALHLAIIVLDVVALWLIAGRSWVRVGWFLWFPLVASEMAAGQLNILCAAAIVEAQRGRVWPLAVMAWAKIWPALALPPRSWRPFALSVAAFAVIALPWPYLFPDWIAALIGNVADPIAPLVPIPFLVRLPVAAGLIVLQRPWSRALGAMIASPNLYWGQLVVVIAPIAVWAESRGWQLPRGSSE